MAFARVAHTGDFDDAVLILIRDLVARFIEHWGRVPSLIEIKHELAGKES
jgi:hypothetical protein